ncbi:MAG: HD domain-containing protein, partial [Actinomycetota bacterium]|nr:HD domain-containing protein [Actinomycetota bacterium]
MSGVVSDVPQLGEPHVGLRDQLLAYARDLRAALVESRAATEELSRTQLETVAALAAAIDVRDEVTGGHVYRVANYGLVLAEQLAPPLANDPQLVYGFLLHDIGKLGVPDRVLLKQGPLDADERALMRAHVEHGVRFVEQVTFLRPALEVVATHHEAWDGSGYPRGLKGAEIPFVTRLFSVCDAFDAMVHDRPYRKAMPPEAALEELRRGSGTQFDPRVVEGFEECADRVISVGERPNLDVTPRASRRRRRGLDHEGSLVFDAMED